jgi:peroxiredoxin Q/BCP
VGSKAPDFSAPASSGKKIKLSDFRGKKPVVLYFYPKDDTPGCTAEAESFRDGLFDFGKHEAVIVGVSLDNVDSHKKFAHKYKLAFPLIADTHHEIADKYGVATRNGFAERVTFVIDRNGVIAKVFPRVVVTGHARKVLAAVEALAKTGKK